MAKMKSEKHKTIYDIKINLDKYNYNYQNELTSKLDNLSGNFNQRVINEIILWKVNRYAVVDKNTFFYLNKIKNTDRRIDINITKIILEKLLLTKGIRLPIASSILRYKNPYLYQIIDQRVYRLINNHELKVPSLLKDQIKLYLSYLKALKSVCKKKKIPFDKSDRILYELDKKINKDIKLNNYG